MSYFPHRNRVYSLDSAFNERAPPRQSEKLNRCHHHPVVPVHHPSAPHYAQASQLYPMRVRSDSGNTYLYRPGINLTSSPTLSPTNLSPWQAISLPVVHLSGAQREAGQRWGTIEHLSPASKTEKTLLRSVRTAPNRKVAMTDAEAEVDALTNELLRSMETRSQASFTSSGTTNMESGSKSTAGTVLRVIASQPANVPSAVLPTNRVTRLQPQLIGGTVSTGSPLPTLNGGKEGSQLSNGSAVSSALMPATSGGDSLSQDTCFRCRRKLTPPRGSTICSPSPSQSSNNTVTLTGALAVRLHSACFTCYRCSKPLMSDGYYHSYRRLLCPSCVRDGAVESCSACHRPISERIVRALGLPYHPGCFVCAVCSCRLDSKPFTVDVHGRPHCLEDFYRRYAPRCLACSQPIMPEQGSRVVMGDSNYHFKCSGMSPISPQKASLTT